MIDWDFVMQIRCGNLSRRMKSFSSPRFCKSSCNCANVNNDIESKDLLGAASCLELFHRHNSNLVCRNLTRYLQSYSRISLS